MWRLDDALVERFYNRAAAQRWQLSRDAFAAFLLTSARRAFGEQQPDARKLERYFESLHLEDLALACACAEGHEGAWDAFIAEQRPVLYRAADALDPWGGAREAADSLYGELFGLKSEDGQRKSHLRYFHGRSSLATWLRAVLAQRYVDRRRLAARVEPLPDEETAETMAAAHAQRQSAAIASFIEVLRRVMAAVVAALAPRDRLRLRLYYAQDMTLAQVGKALGESEATASRQLMKTRRTIREAVMRTLREDERMSEAAIDEGFAAVVDDAGTLDLAELVGAEPAARASTGRAQSVRAPVAAGKKPAADRSK